MTWRNQPLIGCGIALLATVLIVAGFAIFAPFYATQLWWVVRVSLFWALPLAVLLAMATGAASLSDKDNGPAAAGLGLLTIAGGIIWLGWLFAHEYQQDRHYVASVQVVTEPVPALEQRTPYNVSAAQVRPNLGDIPGDVQETSFLPDLGAFVTPVERRGVFTGYQTLLVQDINETGRNTPSKCDFKSVADRRFGGFWSHSLGRLINSTQRGVNWSASDTFGWCDRGVPKVVVPLKEQDGWLVVTERPAGVAVYDGFTGELEIRRDAGGIPGPTYPLSLAAAQRESTEAISGFGDWFWNRAGWELPDEVDAINSDNSSEFVLATTAGGEVYVTPLTGRGSATAISAISMADAQLRRGDVLQPLRVHRTRPVWLSPTSLTERVRADFGDVFATQREARVFELAPLGGNRWTVSIGLPQNLIYRVQGVGDLSDPPCLFTLEGRQLRCGPAVNVAGAGPGVALSPGAQSVPVPVSSDLTGLSDQELVDLINRANQETARRLVEAGG